MVRGSKSMTEGVSSKDGQNEWWSRPGGLLFFFWVEGGGW